MVEETAKIENENRQNDSKEFHVHSRVHSCARRVGFCLIAGAHSKEKIEEES